MPPRYANNNLIAYYACSYLEIPLCGEMTSSKYLFAGNCVSDCDNISVIEPHTSSRTNVLPGFGQFFSPLILEEMVIASYLYKNVVHVTSASLVLMVLKSVGSQYEFSAIRCIKKEVNSDSASFSAGCKRFSDSGVWEKSRVLKYTLSTRVAATDVYERLVMEVFAKIPVYVSYCVHLLTVWCDKCGQQAFNIHTHIRDSCRKLFSVSTYKRREQDAFLVFLLVWHFSHLWF